MRTEPFGNDRDRERFLDKSSTASAQDLLTNDNYVSEAIGQRSKELYDKHHEARADLRITSSNKAEQVEKHNKEIGNLTQGISHFHSGVTNRNQRLGLPPSSLSMFGMPGDRGGLAQVRIRKNAVQYAHDCIDGDAISVKKGQDPMVNPSAEDIQALLDTAQEAITNLSNAERDYVKVQERITELRWQVGTLRNDILGEFRKTLRNKTQTRQRRIMRRYGFSFTSSPGSGEEEDPFEVDDPIIDPTEAPEGGETGGGSPVPVSPEVTEPEQGEEPEQPVAPEEPVAAETVS